MDENEKKGTANETVKKLATVEVGDCILCGANCTCYTKQG
jgi:hypothetical protein